MISRMLFPLFLITAILYARTPLQAGMDLVSSGFCSKIIKLDSGAGINLIDSKLTASETMEISGMGELNGDKTSLLKSPIIKITTAKFNFRGTIECSGPCDIIVKEDFNKNMFKRKGGGNFSIIVDPKHKVFTTYIEAPLEEEEEERLPQEEKLPTPEPTFEPKDSDTEAKTSIHIHKLGLLEFEAKQTGNPAFFDILKIIKSGSLQDLENYLEKNQLKTLEESTLTLFMTIAGLHKKKMDMAKKFIELGANANKSVFINSRKSFKPLFLAVITNKSSFTKLLVAEGADPNESKKEMLPPIYIAAKSNDLKTVIELLKARNIRVDYFKEVVFGRTKTALEIAAQEGHFEIAKVLLEAGARINLALNYAREKNREKIIPILEEQLEKVKAARPIMTKIGDFIFENPVVLAATFIGVGALYVYLTREKTST